MKLYLASIPNVVGLILAVVKDISQLALCKYRLVVAPHTSFSPEYITSGRVKIINIALFCLLLPGTLFILFSSYYDGNTIKSHASSESIYTLLAWQVLLSQYKFRFDFDYLNLLLLKWLQPKLKWIGNQQRAPSPNETVICSTIPT